MSPSPSYSASSRSVALLPSSVADSVPSSSSSTRNQSSSSIAPAGQLVNSCSPGGSAGASSAWPRVSSSSCASSSQVVSIGSQLPVSGTHCIACTPSTEVTIAHASSPAHCSSVSHADAQRSSPPIAVHRSSSLPHCTSALHGSHGAAPWSAPPWVTFTTYVPPAGASTTWSQSPSASSLSATEMM
jgi:hypothetical protein